MYRIASISASVGVSFSKKKSNSSYVSSGPTGTNRHTMKFPRPG